MTIALNPGSADAYYARGIAKVHLEDYEGQISDYTRAIEINPNYADAYFARGIAKLLFGQKESARLDLSKAGELGNTKAWEAIKEYCQNESYGSVP